MITQLYSDIIKSTNNNNTNYIGRILRISATRYKVLHLTIARLLVLNKLKMRSQIQPENPKLTQIRNQLQKPQQIAYTNTVIVN